MGKRSGLTKEEKQTITNLSQIGHNPLQISRLVGRSPGAIGQFLKDPYRERKKRADKGKFKICSKEEIEKLQLAYSNNPLATSGEIFNQAGIENVNKTTRNNILRKVARTVGLPNIPAVYIQEKTNDMSGDIAEPQPESSGQLFIKEEPCDMESECTETSD